MTKPTMTLQEKQILLNKLVGELNENLALIDEFEDINEVKVSEIEKLRKDILAVNPDFKDDYENEILLLNKKTYTNEIK